MKESFMACPTCLAFDDDLKDADAGTKCPECGEGIIKPMTREEFFRTISRKIIAEFI
jgi:hypothetical protein